MLYAEEVFEENQKIMETERSSPTKREDKEKKDQEKEKENKDPVSTLGRLLKEQSVTANTYEFIRMWI